MNYTELSSGNKPSSLQSGTIVGVLNGLNKLMTRARRSEAASKNPPSVVHAPDRLTQAQHGIDRAAISANALKVLNRLDEAGFDAYVVGGGVRDLLLGHEPKDFDVATSASPEEVRSVFRNCRLIGRRFRLAHIFFGRDIIEVATFRSGLDDGSGARKVVGERLVRDNVYGTIEEDAERRDFTINSLYYNVQDNVVLDFLNGFDDLKSGTLRLIGDPATRYQEDPVRMLRAARFAAKLGFRLHAQTEQPIAGLGHLLEDISSSRIYDESLKLFLTGHGHDSFEILRHYDLFRYLFPDTNRCLAQEEEGFPLTFAARALESTDTRVSQGKPVIPAFLFAALLWDPMRLKARDLQQGGLDARGAHQAAADWIMARQIKHTSIPRRSSWPMREIWDLQPRFEQRRGKRALSLLRHPRFRAAYDFLLLRAEEDQELSELAAWWTDVQKLPIGAQQRKVMGAKSRRRGKSRKKQAATSD